MATVTLPYLWTPTINGHRYAYFRPRGGKPIRIRAADGSYPLPGDPAFLAAYMAAGGKDATAVCSLPL